MIGGAVHGSGGVGLGTHNAAPQEADDARPGASRGLMADGIKDQISELSSMAKATGHKSPIRHVYASPPPGANWGQEEWGDYWQLYERALGLDKSPFSEAIHDKPGEHGRDAHRHRVYLATTERGTLVRTGWDYAAQEAVSRIMEFRTGQAFTKGAHNIRALRIIQRLGFPEVADAIQKAGLTEGPRARAKLSPQERVQQERTQVSKADVAQSVSEAWQSSDSGHAFAHALRESGLILAMGDKVPVVVDGSGNTHSLTRMLAMSARSNGEPSPRSQDVTSRLQGVELPSLAEVREQAARAVPVEAAPIVAPEPPQPGSGVSVPVIEVPSQDTSHSHTATSMGGELASADVVEIR